jgi:hypothetical protein
MQSQSSSAVPHTPAHLTTITSADVQQGRILWLARKPDTLATLRNQGIVLADPVVSATHPEITAEDGLYGHPILVVSRPSTDPNVIHFVYVCLPSYYPSHLS